MQSPKATAFCINCRDDRSYIITSQRTENEVRGIRFSYVELIAHCANCGEELYLPEVNDANVQAQEDAYREAAGLINVSEITRLLEKYSIGAGPLAKIMGYGDITINRYVNGQLPSKKHSDELLEVLASHRKMETMLEKNKESISPVAYKKCKDAIDQLNALYGNDRIDLVARYILNKSSSDITPMALQKLLYYAQSFFRALFGVDLFCDNCQAWIHGPVYPDVYFKYREYGYDPIEKPFQYLEEDLLELTTREIDFLNSIISAFGCYSGNTLSRITHSEQPWIEARGNLKASDRGFTEISKTTVDRYFKQIIENYQIVNPCDIKKYSREMNRRTIL